MIPELKLPQQNRCGNLLAVPGFIKAAIENECNRTTDPAEKVVANIYIAHICIGSLSSGGPIYKVSFGFKELQVRIKALRMGQEVSGRPNAKRFGPFYLTPERRDVFPADNLYEKAVAEAAAEAAALKAEAATKPVAAQTEWTLVGTEKDAAALEASTKAALEAEAAAKPAADADADADAEAEAEAEAEA
jgi:hypothetical protein